MTKNKNILEHAWCEIYTSILKRTSQKHFFRTYPKKNLNQKNNWGTKPSPTFNDINVFHFCLEISQLPRRIGNISDNDWSFNATWEHRVCTLMYVIQVFPTCERCWITEVLKTSAYFTIPSVPVMKKESLSDQLIKKI